MKELHEMYAEVVAKRPELEVCVYEDFNHDGDEWCLDDVKVSRSVAECLIRCKWEDALPDSVYLRRRINNATVWVRVLPG